MTSLNNHHSSFASGSVRYVIDLASDVSTLVAFAVGGGAIGYVCGIRANLGTTACVFTSIAGTAVATISALPQFIKLRRMDAQRRAHAKILDESSRKL